MPGRPIVIVGEYYDPTLSIGGGPIIPPAQPPGIWGGPGSLPPFIWGGTPGLPGGGNIIGGGPIYPPQQPGVPTHPIFYPPVINGGPGSLPPFPSHPIYNPPPLGIWGPGQMPPGFWGGGMGPGVKPQPPGEGGGDSGARPEHPIYIPIIPPGGGEVPTQPINEPPTDNPYWQQVFLPNVGWVWAVVPPPNWNPGQGGGSGGGQPPSGGSGGEGGGDEPQVNPLPSR